MIKVRYFDGRGVLREVLRHATERGFAVAEVATGAVHNPTIPLEDLRGGGATELPSSSTMIEVTLKIHGTGSVNELAAVLSEVEGIDAVYADDVNNAGE